MAYDPSAPTRQQRSSAYWMQLIGMIGTVLCIAFHLLSPTRQLPGLLFGLALGGPLASAVAWRADDYFVSLCNMGQRFMAAGLSILTFVWWFWYDLVNDGMPSARSDDLLLFALLVILCYFAGYTFAFVRDRVWDQSEP